MTECGEVWEVSDLIRIEGYACFTRCTQDAAPFSVLQEHQNRFLRLDACVDLYFNSIRYV